MRWLHSLRKRLLLAALALGVLAVAVVVIDVANEDGAGDGLGFLAVGAGLLVPLAIPLLALRSRWYRLLALVCALVALMTYAVLALGGAGLLFPSALIVGLTIFRPEPQ